MAYDLFTICVNTKMIIISLLENIGMVLRYENRINQIW